MLRNLIGRIFGGGHRRTRPALHQTMESMVQSGELKPKDQQAIEFALSHPRLMRELARRMNNNAKFDPNIVSPKDFDVLETSPAKQRPVLKWLWNNRQVILGIVWTLLSVFGIKLPPLPVIGPTNPEPVAPQPAPSNPPATGAGPQPVK